MPPPYPPQLPPATRNSMTPQAGNHADDHNKVAAALAQMVEVLGDTEADGTPGRLSETGLSATIAAASQRFGTRQTAALASTADRGTRFVMFGDSHVEGSSVQGTGSDYRTNKNYPVGAGMTAWAMWLTRKRFINWANYGIGGERTDQIFARVADPIATGADVCILQMGTNDSRQGYSMDHTIQYYEGTVEALLDAGLDVVLVGVPPCGGPPANDPVAVQDGQDARNVWIEDYARRMNLPFVDVFTGFADANRHIAAIYNADGVHLNALGAKVAGQRITNVIDATYGLGEATWLTTSNTDTNNMLVNALAATDANADGVPDSWTTLGTPTGGTATHTLETVPGWLGKAIAVEQAANTNARQVLQDLNVNTGKFAPGDRLRVAVRAKVSGGATIQAYVAFTGSTTGQTQSRLLQVKTTTEAGEDLLAVHEVTVPTGTTNVAFRLYVDPGTGKAWFGQPTMVNLTKLGLA